MPKTPVTISRTSLEKHRSLWAGVAKENGWYVEPFFVQIWLFADGVVQDSVSFRDMEQDIFVLVEPDPDAEYENDIREIAVIEPTIIEDC